MAFCVKEYIGYKAMEKVEKSYIRRALQRLLPNPKVCILGNTDVKRQAILSFLVYSTADFSSSSSSSGKPLHGALVAKLLNDLFGIQARGGCACAGPYGHTLLNIDHHHALAFRSLIQKGYVGIKPGWTRVSFPYYMSEEEFEFILAAIEFIAIHGQRFLCCYHFDWRTGVWSFKKNINALKDHQYGSSLVRMFKVLNMKQDVVRFTNYLETANRMATLLPKFPPQRKTPKEIDVDLLPFRV